MAQYCAFYHACSRSANIFHGKLWSTNMPRQPQKMCWYDMHDRCEVILSLQGQHDAMWWKTCTIAKHHCNKTTQTIGTMNGLHLWRWWQRTLDAYWYSWHSAFDRDTPYLSWQIGKSDKSSELYSKCQSESPTRINIPAPPVWGSSEGM